MRLLQSFYVFYAAKYVCNLMRLCFMALFICLFIYLAVFYKFPCQICVLHRKCVPVHVVSMLVTFICLKHEHRNSTVNKVLHHTALSHLHTYLGHCISPYASWWRIWSYKGPSPRTFLSHRAPVVSTACHIPHQIDPGVPRCWNIP
jgi:hypothetical protein